VHPLNLLTDEEQVVIECFTIWKSGGGFGGMGPLPFAGGYAEQPCALMRAFRYMAAMSAKFDRKKG
jgi:hypothetical protein